MVAAKQTTKKTAPKKAAGPSVEGYFAQQPADKRALLEKLRALVVKGVPDAKSTIKWGVPFFQRDGKNVCALAATRGPRRSRKEARGQRQREPHAEGAHPRRHRQREHPALAEGGRRQHLIQL